MKNLFAQKIKKNKTICFFFLLSLIWIQYGCSNNNSGSVNENLQTGTFIDSPVEGLKYETPSFSGFTDKNGQFLFRDGENVSFYIGGVFLGTAESNQTITPIDLTRSTIKNRHNMIINICRLIQSIDDDGIIEDGIKISDNVTSKLNEFNSQVDFTLESDAFSNEVSVKEIFGILNSDEHSSPNRHYQLISNDQAKNHFIETLEQRNLTELIGLISTPEANPTLNLLGVWPSGHSDAIATDGERALAFIGIGAGIAVLDIHDSESITKLSQISISDIVQDLFYDSEKLYVAGGRIGGFYIIDVSNPQYPIEILQYETSGTVSGVFIRDNFSFIADGYDGGLRILDISRLDSPVEISHYETPGMAGKIYVSGSYVFLAVGHMGLKVFDISNPATPQLVGENDIWADHVFVQGGNAYVASNSDFVILDISDPNNPLVTAKAYARGYPKEIHVSGGIAYIACSKGGNISSVLELFNIEDPYNPVHAGRYHIYSNSFYEEARGVSVVGSHAYIKTNTGIQVIDVDDHSDIMKLGEYYFPAIEDFSIYGSYAYVTNGDLTILDLNDLKNPTNITEHITPGDADGVKAIGDYVYIGDGREGLEIVDVKDPYAPQTIGHYDYAGRIGPIYVSGGYVFFAEGAELSIIDVSMPDNPTSSISILEQVRSIIIENSEAQPREVFVSGTKAYITMPGHGSSLTGGTLGSISIIDIGNPAQPELVGSYLPNSFHILDTYLVENIAYIADADKLRIVNFENPLTPMPINTINTNWARGVTVSGDYAVIADNLSLRVFDIRDLNNLSEVANYPIPRWVEKIEMIDNYIYFADKFAGLFILELMGFNN